MVNTEIADAWKEYRRRRIEALAAFVAAFIIPGILLFVPRCLGRIGTVFAYVALVATYIWFGIAIARFWNWKCPQCKRRFIGIYEGFSFLRRKCFYCGLGIDCVPSNAVALSTERF
jgi:hypothetical protein